MRYTFCLLFLPYLILKLGILLDTNRKIINIKFRNITLIILLNNVMATLYMILKGT